MSRGPSAAAEHEVYALTTAVRAGTLSAVQRERLVALLLQLETTVAMGQRESYPVEERVWFLDLCWEPVRAAYTELREAPPRVSRG